MYTTTIISQIKAWLPEFTSYFAEEQSIASINIVNGLCTVTTLANHNLLTDDVIYIKNANVPIKISAITKESADSIIATVTTSTYHDQTTGYTTISEIEGVVDSLYNGDMVFIEDIDSTHFTITVDSATAQTPDITDAYLILEKKQLVNGWKTITKLSDTTFSYQETLTDLNGLVENSGIVLIKNQRVYGCSDYADAYDLYCNSFGKKNTDGEIVDVLFKTDSELTLYIDLQPVVRNTATKDTSQGMYSFLLSLYVFAPIKNSRRYLARDKMSFLQSEVMNKILGDKRLQTDDLYSVPETELLKFIQSRMAATRDRVIYPYEFQYEFKIRTWSTDFALPYDSTRLNKLVLRSSIEDSDELSTTNVDY